MLVPLKQHAQPLDHDAPRTRQPNHPKHKHEMQIGGGTSDQRVVEPGKGLVGQAVAAGKATTAQEGGGGDDAGGILMTSDPSKEKAFVAEFDLPVGEDPAGDR